MKTLYHQEQHFRGSDTVKDVANGLLETMPVILSKISKVLTPFGWFLIIRAFRPAATLRA
jgi:hypothetical protein